MQVPPSVRERKVGETDDEPFNRNKRKRLDRCN